MSQFYCARTVLKSGYFGVWANVASKARVRAHLKFCNFECAKHTQLVGEKSPQAPGEKSLRIFALSLHIRVVCTAADACGKRKNDCHKRKIFAEFFYLSASCLFFLVRSLRCSPSILSSISAFFFADCKSKT